MYDSCSFGRFRGTAFGVQILHQTMFRLSFRPLKRGPLKMFARRCLFSLKVSEKMQSTLKCGRNGFWWHRDQEIKRNSRGKQEGWAKRLNLELLSWKSLLEAVSKVWVKRFDRSKEPARFFVLVWTFGSPLPALCSLPATKLNELITRTVIAQKLCGPERLRLKLSLESQADRDKDQISWWPMLNLRNW